MIESVKAIIADKKVTLAGVAASILVWWFFIGRNKYGTKGLRSYR